MTRPRKICALTTFICFLILISGWISCDRNETPSPYVTAQQDYISILKNAYNQKRSGFFVKGQGRILRILTDDLKGSRHQRFIVSIPGGQTLLISHNIDIAPRIEGISVGDEIVFSGRYEWNDKGGVIHWTHHDPQNLKSGGWIEYSGRKYY